MEGDLDIITVGGDEDALVDYDDGDNFDFSTDSEAEDEKEPQEYPRTPEERISWQEHIRMIHLRSHINQLSDRLKQAQYTTDKAREELKMCRAHKCQLENERDMFFKQIQEQESNKAAIYRLRAAHKRVCLELGEEDKLEQTIQQQLEKAELDLALAEVEKGKFLLAEEELLQKEELIAKEKMQSAHIRQQREERLAVTARLAKIRDARQKAKLLEEKECRQQKLIKDAERSHVQASKYLHKTLEKMKRQEQAEQEQYQNDMQQKMEMLVKLKTNMDSIQENIRTIQARDRTVELKKKQVEAAERQRILDEGGNADQQIRIQKRLREQAERKQMFEERQLQQRISILDHIVYEEKQLQKKKKQWPQLWNDPNWEKSLRVAPRKPKPVKLLKNYIMSSSGDTDDSPVVKTRTLSEEDEKQDQEKAVLEDDFHIPNSADSSDHEFEEPDKPSLAVPEFEGLWEQNVPPKVPREVEPSSRLPGASKMEKEILAKVLKKHRENIVVKQVAGGREFHGCPFYSKPDIIHFKDFDVGKVYRKKVVLTNVSYTVNYCRYTDLTERLKDFIKIKFDPPGQMSAGMTCDLEVTFKPMINEDLFGEITFLSQTGPFSIPLKCTIKRCDLRLDVDKVDFGTAVIGETLKHSFTLSNHGALGTKFDFFKVTGMKQHTITTGGTSLGRLTTDSLRGVSSDLDTTEKVQQIGSGVDKPPNTAEKSQEGAAEEAREVSKMPQVEGSEIFDLAAMEAEAPADSEKMFGQELVEVMSPDLAVSDMDYSLDGMHVGAMATGEIGPFSSVRLEIVWRPTVPGQVHSEFLVTFADTHSSSLPVSVLANGIDVPVWVERQTVDLKICMYDRLYQDTVIINNRATTALKLKFEVCRDLRNHLEVLPHNCYIQAHSQFSAQLKFLPRKSLHEEAKRYFDIDTGVLEVPVLIQVAEQTNPVSFTVNAVVTNSDMEFDVQHVDFGPCTVYESVCAKVHLMNKSILPQDFGFLDLVECMEVQPNDGFGTLLPLETIELDLIFSPQKAFDYKFDLVCKSMIDRDFRISCTGVGVLPPLQLSGHVIHFPATTVFDVAMATVHVINSHTSSNEYTQPVPRIGTTGKICPVGPTSFEFVVPKGAPISVSPAVGTVAPGSKVLVQVRFTPSLSDEDIHQEAARLKKKMEATQLEQEQEKTLKEAMELPQKGSLKAIKQDKGKPQSPIQAGSKSSKSSAKESSKASGSKNSKVSGSQSHSSVPLNQDSTSKPGVAKHVVEVSEHSLYTAATTSLLRQFEGSFTTFVVPCYVACREPSGKLSHSVENTLFLEVHCPVVRPQLIVISNSGMTTTDFGEVSIGQNKHHSITIQNISDQNINLSSSILDTRGPFVLVNALRPLSPGATHTMIISFTPAAGCVFQEPLQIKTGTSSLYLTLVGQGVSPIVRLSVEDQLLDMGAVLVNEFVEKPFKIENTSSVPISYVIKLDSLSSTHHMKAQCLPHFLHADSTITNYVGVQNKNGQNVFDIVPAEGIIPPGETKEIVVTFAPDHESMHYSDGVRIELFSEKETHFFQLRGEACKALMFITGGDPLYPEVESLGILSSLGTLSSSATSEEVMKSAPVPMLLTLRSRMRNEEFLPATSTIFVCCVRTMGAAQKKNGEFQCEEVQQLSAKGITIDPQKGLVDSGTRKPVTITWTPLQGHNPNKVLQESVFVTLKGDVVEQYQLTLHLLVVSA